MTPYIVKVVDREAGTKHSHVALANSWHEAWLIAIDTYGLRCVVSVRPGVRRAAATGRS